MVNLFKHLSHSTESKVKDATNFEPLGPYNKELLDISVLSHNPKQLLIIESALSKRLKSYIDEYSSNPSTRSRSFSLRRSASTNTNSYSDIPTPRRTSVDAHLSRSNSYHGEGNQDKQSLTVLKTLTVILYLLQYGSSQFIDWIKIKFIDIILPLNAMEFHASYNQSIKSKISTIIKYCESTTELSELRVNIHKLRSDMATPGLKKSVTISEELQYSPPNSPMSSNSNFQFSSKYYDSPTYDHRTTPYNGNNHHLIDSRLHDLTPVHEENTSLHSQTSATNLLNCHDENLPMSNNPFQIPNLFR